MSSRRSGSLASLREGNRRRVIDALRERGVASRAELARATELSRSTISTIVGDLIDSGLAVERDGQPEGEAHAGRPGVMVALDSSAGLALAIDFGHRHLRVAVSDLSHTVLAETLARARRRPLRHRRPRRPRRSSSTRSSHEAKVDRGRVIGAVMGLPAPINRATGTVQDSSILPGLGRDRRGGGGQRAARPAGGGRERRQPRRARRADLGRGEGPHRGRLPQGRLGHRRRPDLGRAPDPRGRRHRRRDRPHRRRLRTGRSAAAATAAAWRRSPRPARSRTSSR